MLRHITPTSSMTAALLTLDCGHTAQRGEATGNQTVDCANCDRRIIPLAAVPGRRTPTFDAESVPPALLRAHITKAWAELIVVKGSVLFVDESPVWRTRVTAPGRVTILPNRQHRIEPDGDASFYVQFHDLTPEPPTPDVL